MVLTDETVHVILGHPAQDVLDFIHHNLDSVDGSLPWQALAQGLSERANSPCDPATPSALNWASAAVLLFDRLGERCDDERSRFASIKAAMSLRAQFLNSFGAERGHAVLDPMILEAWFFRSLSWRYERVVQMLNSESDLSSDQARDLNRLRSGIRILKSVNNQEVFQRSDELALWYAVAD